MISSLSLKDPVSVETRNKGLHCKLENINVDVENKLLNKLLDQRTLVSKDSFTNMEHTCENYLQTESDTRKELEKKQQALLKSRKLTVGKMDNSVLKQLTSKVSTDWLEGLSPGVDYPVYSYASYGLTNLDLRERFIFDKNLSFPRNVSINPLLEESKVLKNCSMKMESLIDKVNLLLKKRSLRSPIVDFKAKRQKFQNSAKPTYFRRSKLAKVDKDAFEEFSSAINCVETHSASICQKLLTYDEESGFKFNMEVFVDDSQAGIKFPEVAALTSSTDSSSVHIEFIQYVSSKLLVSFDRFDPNLEDCLPKLELMDPEFILKVALYTRQDLNLRQVSNYLLAYSANSVRCRPFLKKYYSATIVLPTDWLAVAQFYKKIQDVEPKTPLHKLPACLRKVMKAKFPEFSEYQLNKYNRKSKNPEREFSLKSLIRTLHIDKPANSIMCILGKKYPESSEDFSKSGLEGTYDSRLAGKRMKFPPSQTWENMCSLHGSTKEVWQKLISDKKLPYMASLRNVRNLIKANVDDFYHKKVQNFICNETAVANGRQLPIRYLNCLESFPKYDKNDPKRKIVDGYRSSVIKAMEVSVKLNLPVIRGRTAIFCFTNLATLDRQELNGKSSFYKIQYLLAWMFVSACEWSEVFTMSGGDFQEIINKKGSRDAANSILEYILRNDSSDSSNLDFDMNWKRIMKDLEKIISESIHFDNFIFINNCSFPKYLQNDTLLYRKKVNPKINIYHLTCGFPKNVQQTSGIVTISGFSDQILRFVAENGADKQLQYINKIDEIKGLRKQSTENFKTRLESSFKETPFFTPVKCQHRIIRVFLSSTFIDMEKERDVLLRYVIPELKRRSFKKGISVIECDLRWGITGHMKKNHKLIETCLTQVQRCDLFVGIVGNRYGWCPDALHFPKSKKFGWLDAKKHGGMSMTHLEILQALENNHSSCEFFIRSVDDFSTINIESDEKKNRLKELKSFLGSRHSRLVTNYYEDACFGEMMLNNLWQRIETMSKEEDSQLASEDVIIKTAKQHLSLISHGKEDYYSSNEQLLTDLIDLLYLDSKDNERKSKVICITSEVGFGKTTFISELFRQSLITGDKKLILSKLFYVIGSPLLQSTDLGFMIKCLSAQLDLIVEPAADSEILKKEEDEVLFWHKLSNLMESHPNHRFIIGIDGLDALTSHQHLQWIPHQLPSNVTLVVSTSTSSDVLKILQHRNDLIQKSLKPLDIWSTKKILEKLLSKHGKSIESQAFNNSQKLLQLKKDSTNPLYLYAVTEYLRLFAVFEKLDSQIREIPDRLLQMMIFWLESVEKEFSEVSYLVPLITGLVLSSRGYGTDEEEIYSICQFFCLHRNNQQLDKIEFLQVLHSLNIFFTIIPEEGGFKLSFSNFVNSQAVTKKYFLQEDDLKPIHQLQASYYMTLLTNKSPDKKAYLLSLLKLPYHLACAGQVEVLKHLLENLQFITSKCVAGYVVPLIDDYNLLFNHKIFPDLSNTSSVQQIYQFLKTSFQYLKEQPNLIHQLAVNYDKYIRRFFYKKPAKQAVDSLSETNYLLKIRDTKIHSHFQRCCSSFCLPTMTKSLAFSPNGQLLACGTYKDIYIVDQVTSKINQKLSTLSSTTCLHFLTNHLLLSGHSVGGIALWSIKEGLLERFDIQSKEITEISANQELATVVTSSLSGHLKIYNIKTNGGITGPVLTIQTQNDVAINCISLHPSTAIVAAGLWNGSIEIYKLDNGKCVDRKLGCKSPVRHLEYSLCGNFILCNFLHQNKFLRFYPAYNRNSNENENKESNNLFETCIQEPYVISNFAPIPDNRKLVLCSGWKQNFYSDTDLRLMSAYSVELTANHISASSPAASVSFSKHHSLYGVGYKDGQICFYDEVDLKMSTSARLNYSPVVHLSWMQLEYADNPLVLVAHQDGSIQIVEVKTNCKVLREFMGHFGELLALDVSNRYLVSSDNNGLVRLWELPTKKADLMLAERFLPLVQLSAHSGACLCVSILNQFLVTGGKDKNLNFYNINNDGAISNSDAVVVKNAHCNWIISCSINSGKDTKIVSACNCDVKVWERSGKLIYQFRTSSEGRINSISFNPQTVDDVVYSTSVGEVFICKEKAEALMLKSDSIKTSVLSFMMFDGKVIVSYEDGTVRVWLLNKTKNLSTFAGHCSPITSFACTSQLAASASIDGTVKCWNLNSEQKSKYNFSDSHDYAVTFMDKDRDQHVISGCSKEVKLWKVTSEELHLVGTFVFNELPKKMTVVACGTFEGNMDSLIMVTVTKWNDVYTSKLRKGSVTFEFRKKVLLDLICQYGFTLNRKKYLSVNEKSYAPSRTHWLDIHDIKVFMRFKSSSDVSNAAIYTIYNERGKGVDVFSPESHSNIVTAWRGGRYAGTNDGFIEVFSNDFKNSKKFYAHDDQITDISSLDDLVVTSSRDCTLKVWKVSGGRELDNLNFKQVGQYFSLISISQIQILRVSSEQKASYTIVCGDYNGCVFTVRMLPFEAV